LEKGKVALLTSLVEYSWTHTITVDNQADVGPVLPFRQSQTKVKSQLYWWFYRLSYQIFLWC